MKIRVLPKILESSQVCLFCELFYVCISYPSLFFCCTSAISWLEICLEDSFRVSYRSVSFSVRSWLAAELEILLVEILLMLLLVVTPL